MSHQENPNPSLWRNYESSQDYNRYHPYDISHGRFDLMKQAGDDVYHGYVVDAWAPEKFWGQREQEINDGQAVDERYFVPLTPDWQNLLKYPRAVFKAFIADSRARKQHGDNFRFVFVSHDSSDNDETTYSVELYVF